MRGMITDLNIFSAFFDHHTMTSYTRGCDQQTGDIFGWDRSKLTIMHTNVTIQQIDKKEICQDLSKPIFKQRSHKSSGNIERKRFKPTKLSTSTYIGSVLEMITDPFGVTPKVESIDAIGLMEN